MVRLLCFAVLCFATSVANACPQAVVACAPQAVVAHVQVAQPVFAQQVYAVPQAVVQSQAVVQYGAAQAVVVAPQAVVAPQRVVQRVVQPRQRVRTRTVQSIRTR